MLFVSAYADEPGRLPALDALIAIDAGAALMGHFKGALHNNGDIYDSA